MNKKILRLSALLFFIGTLNSISAQDLFPSDEVLIVPNLSLTDSEQIGLPDIVFYPQPAAISPLVVSVTSGDWSNPTTWDCGCIPTAINDVLIASGTNVQMTSSSIHNLTIVQGGTLEGGTMSNVLEVTGDIKVRGEFKPGDSEVRLTSASTQSLMGKAKFNNLTVIGDKEVHLLGVMSIRGILTIDGSEVFTNSRLFLVNHQGVNSQLAPLLSGQIIGDIRFESMLTSLGSGWVNIGCPVGDATIEEWNDDFITTGFEGSDYPTYSFTSIQIYEEIGDGEADSYQEITTIDHEIKTGRGYYVYLNPGTYEFDTYGTPVTGDFEFTTTFTDFDDIVNDGLNLLANPYPANINWERESGWTKEGVYNTIYTYDISKRQFKTYLNGFGVNGGSPMIGSTETFWVQAYSDNSMLTANETAKDVNGSSINPSPENYLSITLTNGGESDEIAVVFDDNATTDFNPWQDALDFKAPNTRLAFSTRSNDGTPLSINAINHSVDNLPLYMDIPSDGTYSLLFNHVPQTDDVFCLSIEDTRSDLIYPIKEGEFINFEGESGIDLDRFVLRIGAPLTATATPVVCYGESNGIIEAMGSGDGPWDYFLMSAENQVLQSFEDVATSQSFIGISAGQYSVEITNNDFCVNLTVPFTIEETEQLTGDYGTEELECGEFNTGEILMIAEGGQAPYNYFIDGEPVTYYTQGLAAGTYETSIIDDFGCELTETIEVEGPDNVVAAFLTDNTTYIMEDGQATVDFENITTGGDEYYWDFGDGIGTMGTDVTHTYTSPGLYFVTLTASNEECDDSFGMLLTIENANIITEEALDAIQIIQRDGQAFVQLNGLEDRLDEVVVYNAMGQQISTQEEGFEAMERLDGANATGLYIAALKFGKQNKRFKWINQ